MERSPQPPCLSEISCVGEGYTPETRRLVEYIFQSQRGVEGYKYTLAFKDSADFLKSLSTNSLVLDLGSGEGFLAKELYFRRPDVTVVSLNPALSRKSFRVEQKGFFLSLRDREENWLNVYPWGVKRMTVVEMNAAQRRHDEFAVAAANPGLPFKSEVFDVVFDSMASIHFAKDRLIEKLAEILRVLKPGGKTYVGPVCNDAAYWEICKYLEEKVGLSYQTGLSNLNISPSGLGTAFHISKNSALKLSGIVILFPKMKSKFGLE